MKNLYENSIKVAALAVLLIAAFRCTAQGLRFQTDSGLVVVYPSDNIDEICLNFGLVSGEVRVKHLGKSGNTLKKRLAAAVRMADEAGVDYRTFLIETGLKDSRAIQVYYAKCRKLRTQFLNLMPERALLEIRHLTAYLR